MKKIPAFFLLIITACNQPEHKRELVMPPTAVKTDSVKTKLKNLAFDSKTDLVCGMPVKAGVEDTVLYKGKVYGFCAKECKEEFLKDPKQYLTAK